MARPEMAAAQQPVRAYIGIGSNLSDPQAQVRAALKALACLPCSRLAAHSGLYRSRPLAGMDQPDYINAVAAIDTTLDPHALLAALQALENDQGRVRDGERWAARTLDLDLLLYGDRQLATDTLTVPHPGLRERSFVLYPLQEIAAQLRLPDGARLSDVIEACTAAPATRIGDA